jgi:hypothetical protein
MTAQEWSETLDTAAFKQDQRGGAMQSPLARASGLT